MQKQIHLQEHTPLHAPLHSKATLKAAKQLVNDLLDVECLARTHFKVVNSSFFLAAFEKSSNKSL
jgi:hypothetical protein